MKHNLLDSIQNSLNLVNEGTFPLFFPPPQTRYFLPLFIPSISAAYSRSTIQIIPNISTSALVTQL